MSDFEVIDAEPAPRLAGNRKPGQGRGSPGVQRAPGKVAFEEARARHEQAKAELAELEIGVRTGRYVERASVQRATATAVATLTQGLRSLPDNLERRFALEPEVVEAVSQAIDAALEDLSFQFEMMAGSGDAA